MNQGAESSAKSMASLWAIRESVTAYAAVTLAVLISYGYEIFNFNLTIDEEVHGAGLSGIPEWVAQGRWATALLNYWVLPNPVGPVTSTFIGVLGATIGLWMLVKSAFDLDDYGTAAVTASTVTMPTLAFILTFSTLAYGIGVGFVTIATGIAALRVGSIPRFLLACVLGAFAIGIYQPFVFAIVICAGIRALGDSKTRGVRRYALWAGYVAGSTLLYALCAWIAIRMTSSSLLYVGELVDVAGFFANPVARMHMSFLQLMTVIRLEPAYFGLTSIWLGVVLASSACVGLGFPLIRWNIRTVITNAVMLATIFAVVVLAGALARGFLPIRSLIYLPVAFAMVFAIGFRECNRRLRLVMCSLVALCVIGNASINNNLFASAAAAEFQDRLVARDIAKTLHEVYPNRDRQMIPMRVVAVGTLAWPDTPIRHRRDTFGASFFEWGGGLDPRIAAYLTLQGSSIKESSGSDRLLAYVLQAQMPSWPSDGWVAIAGDVVILKFGDYSNAQRDDLCAQGVQTMCRKN